MGGGLGGHRRGLSHERLGVGREGLAGRCANPRMPGDQPGTAVGAPDPAPPPRGRDEEYRTADGGTTSLSPSLPCDGPPSRRRVVALVAVLVIGRRPQTGDQQNGGDDAEGLDARAELASRLAGSPAPLAALHRQANLLLPGGAGRASTAAARPEAGTRSSSTSGRRGAGRAASSSRSSSASAPTTAGGVAFLGLDADDNDGNARRFLERFPVSYPSVEDPRERAATSLRIGAVYPITSSTDADGRAAYIHQGGYATPARLARRRPALRAAMSAG